MNTYRDDDRRRAALAYRERFGVDPPPPVTPATYDDEPATRSNHYDRDAGRRHLRELTAALHAERLARRARNRDAR